MKITMADVISINGKITKGDTDSTNQWASKEDTSQFLKLIELHNIIVMGRATYESVRPVPQPGTLRIVLTHAPQKFELYEKPGQLEFRNSSPEQLVADLEQAGHDSLLLLGGGEINAAFLKANLVSDLYLTIEPLLFGEGKNLISTYKDLYVNLSLESVNQLNSNGTLLAHYIIK